MNIICIHYYKEKQFKCLTSEGKCHCDLGLKCPKEFQCPQYKTKSKKENNMLKIGDKIKFNLEKLEEADWEGLKPEDNKNFRDYESYIKQNINNVFTIYNIDDIYAPYQIDDEFLKDTSFSEEELIKVE